jgi:hypothetical protein
VECPALGSEELHIFRVSIAQLLPKIRVPHWLVIKAPPYSSLSDRRPISYLTLPNAGERFQSPFPSPGFLHLGQTDPALGVIALTRTILDIPYQAPASYHVSVMYYVVI